jgi:hypothetical protein
MANPISEEIKIGTIGEILVQLRLLQYGVQAAPPIKDSGNDLIAVKGETFKAIQVKTSTTKEFSSRNLDRLYHILALVDLVREDKQIYLDKSRIFLLSKNEVKKSSYRVDDLSDKILCEKRVDELFS